MTSRPTAGARVDPDDLSTWTDALTVVPSLDDGLCRVTLTPEQLEAVILATRLAWQVARSNTQRGEGHQPSAQDEARSEVLRGALIGLSAARPQGERHGA